MATLSVSPGGSGPLAFVTVTPFGLGNAAVRAVWVECANGATVKVRSGARLRTKHLLVPDSTASRNYRGAVKDANGLWTEVSSYLAASTPNFAAGSIEGSIGSFSSRDIDLSEPALEFPDLSMGSGKLSIRRTLVSDISGKSGDWRAEVRANRWARGRAAFHVKLSDVDKNVSLLLHRFWRALNGPTTPFYFDYTDPAIGTRLTTPSQRYVVRFRDPALADSMFVLDRSELDFMLVEAAPLGDEDV